MASKDSFPIHGGCVCKHIRYRMLTKPLFVHCCHCTWCRRESGSAFNLNAIIEIDQFELLTLDEPLLVKLPSESGKGQDCFRCPKCFTLIWSVYSNPLLRFIRGGTLDEPAACPPSIHIYTTTKLPWVVLADDCTAPIVDEYYDEETAWPRESLERLAELRERFST